MDEACKSNGIQEVAIRLGESGVRVRKTWVTCPEVGDNLPKGGLIPDEVFSRMRGVPKAGILRNLSLQEGPASHQLVGEVTAHQGLWVAGLRGWSATLTEILPRLLREAAVEDHLQWAKA